MGTQTEIEIYPSKVCTFIDDKEQIIPYSLYEEYKNKPIGTRTYASAGAPGIGHIIHEITRIDEKGIYGIVIEDTMQIPDGDFYF